MDNFPDFMMTPANAIPAKSQSDGVKGWVYNGIDGKQTAYWICEKDGHSNPHSHEFEEYFIVIDGEYILQIDGQDITLHKGDEYHIATGITHAGKFKAGTRTFHCFGGNRA